MDKVYIFIPCIKFYDPNSDNQIDVKYLTICNNWRSTYIVLYCTINYVIQEPLEYV